MTGQSRFALDTPKTNTDKHTPFHSLCESTNK
jgi:hypothetical protein